MPSEDYDEKYWSELDGGAGAVDSTVWQDIAHIVKEYYIIDRFNLLDDSNNLRVLDMGCGFGFLVKNLRNRGVEAFGLDISNHALENADLEISEFLNWYDMSSGNNCHFGNEFADVITCFEVLEHIEDGEATDRAIESIWKTVKPGGKILISVCVEGNEGWDRDPTHVNIQSRKYWEDKFKERGFLVDKWLTDRVGEYWIFAKHNGVFSLIRPDA